MVVCTRCKRGEREGWRWWMGVTANQEGCDWCAGVSCGASLQSCYVSMWPVIDMNGMPVWLPLLGTLCSDFCMATMWTSEVQVVVPFSQDHKAFLDWKIHNFYWIDASGNMETLMSHNQRCDICAMMPLSYSTMLYLLWNSKTSKK